jgi:hypothetical protein
MDTSIVAQRIVVFQSGYALCGVHDKKYTIVDMNGSSDGVILPNHPNQMNDSYVLPHFMLILSEDEYSISSNVSYFPRWL